MHLVVGEPIVNVSHLALESKDQIKVTGDQAYTIGDLFTSSDVVKLGTDNLPLGTKK